MNSLRILAVDPGRDKCGLAVTDENGALLWCLVSPRAQTLDAIQQAVEQWSVTQFVVGDSTASGELCEAVGSRWPQIQLQVVDETGSTLEARGLYWQEKPPRGWRRLTPLSLQVPPEPIDDFAALVLARRFLQPKF